MKYLNVSEPAEACLILDQENLHHGLQGNIRCS